MPTSVKILKDSMQYAGKRLTTMQISFQRFILPEFNTHRVFSRNFSSSRAIPTAKLLDQVRNDPAMPVEWGKNQPGMQAKELLDENSRIAAEAMWRSAAREAAWRAEAMATTGVHKQIVNRLIEPYVWVHGVVSSTEWDNWFALRDHPDAQPEIQVLARMMKDAMAQSQPLLLVHGEWHLPYVTDDEQRDLPEEVALKVSAARCCRVSYLKHDGTNPSVEDDIALFDRLAGSVPIHASPLEHVATPTGLKDLSLTGNFRGWIQYRGLWERSIRPELLNPPR